MIDKTLSNAEIIDVISKIEASIIDREEIIGEYLNILIKRLKTNTTYSLGKVEKGKAKPLLGLFNKIIYRPTAYCELKKVYLLTDDIKEKQCMNKGNYKGCRSLTMLQKEQQNKGLKNKEMKFYDYDCSH